MDHDKKEPLTMEIGGLTEKVPELTLADHIPPASVVGNFVMELPSLAAQIPGTVSEVIGALSETLPHLDHARHEHDRELEL